MDQGEIDKAWSRHVAGLAVDGLFTAKIVSETDLERAIEFVAEEVLVRLCAGDRPDGSNWRYVRSIGKLKPRD
jgi:hypothetical protein